jgi:hypothetical protein
LIYDEEDVNNYMTDVFNGLTYTLVKHYNFSMPELVNFFHLYEQETEYKISLEFADAEHFEGFKKSIANKYYKDLFRAE